MRLPCVLVHVCPSCRIGGSTSLQQLSLASVSLEKVNVANNAIEEVDEVRIVLLSMLFPPLQFFAILIPRIRSLNVWYGYSRLSVLQPGRYVR